MEKGGAMGTPVEFSKYVEDAAWRIQNGKCGACGKKLSSWKKNRGTWGAWHPHHRMPVQSGGLGTLDNCVLLCINPPNCNLNVGHQGNYRKKVVVPKRRFPYRYH